MPAPASSLPRIALVAVLAGAVMVAAPLAAIASQGLDPFDRLDALMLALAGLVVAGWGGYRLGARPLLRRDIALHLDEAGVTLQGADSGARLLWPDLARVELAWWEIVPPYVEDAEHLPVLRLVAHDDHAIAVNGAGVVSGQLARAFGISPPAAARTAVVGHGGLGALQQVLDWVGSHQPDVPVEVGAPPAL
ncbi:hypothetical protein GCM10022263_32270 [Nocardioides daeguensis]|uniref:Uncharacterized protein n=1 Tax=Nocardioides daeguensis TaxID=908359 RepID=A0ABP6VX55_9ACTN